MSHHSDSLLHVSQAIESLLVARNLRGMKTLHQALTPGYVARAAQLVNQALYSHHLPCIYIATGFPVAGTFETDGPAGAIALYRTLDALGACPIIVSEATLTQALAVDFNTLTLPIELSGENLVRHCYQQAQPQLIISIERPGLAEDHHYYNMRGEDIHQHIANFDELMFKASCPTVAIGDGGNEVGMGNVISAVKQLDITPAITPCNELIVADVSNWGAYGLIAMLGYQQQSDLLADIMPSQLLSYLSQRDSVDGVTRRNEPTEDGLAAKEGEALIQTLRQLTGFARPA